MIVRKPLMLFALLGGLSAAQAFAGGCQVSTRSLSHEIPSVLLDSCYEYEGMEAGAIDWSCNNETQGMLDHQKQPVARCSTDYLGRCTAALTQEALANPSAVSGVKEGTTMAIPDDAKIVTYVYRIEDKEQARKDCEVAGGEWQGK